MRAALLNRLAKLHIDPQRCAKDYRAARQAFQQRMEFAEALRILTALADPHRLAMVKLLQQYGEMCACDIEVAFDLAHSTLIYHLNLLVEAGIAEVRKEGRWSYYRLSKAFPASWQAITRFVRASQARSIRRCCCRRPTSHHTGERWE